MQGLKEEGILDEIDNWDMSQTKNLSLGGMLLATNRQFGIGTNLALLIQKSLWEKKKVLY